MAVNLSYLAVPNIESSGRIASLCSNVFSIGSIIIGLLLASEDHTDPKSGEWKVSARVNYGTSLLLNVLSQSAIYFWKLKSDTFGYEPLAILYSLPFALLMWR